MMMGFCDAPGPLKAQIANGTSATSNIVHAIANGTSVAGTTTILAIVDGGLPPYTYSWTDNIANLWVQSSTSQSTAYQSTGTDTLKTGVFIVTATDAGGYTAITTVSADITHGTPP